jgi:hypothetical protein
MLDMPFDDVIGYRYMRLIRQGGSAAENDG